MLEKFVKSENLSIDVFKKIPPARFDKLPINKNTYKM